MRYATTHPDVHMVDTGKIIIHNYPPAPRTSAYITRIYEVRTKGSTDMPEIEGDPIYIDTLPDEQQALAVCMGEAQAALSRQMKREAYLIPLKK